MRCQSGSRPGPRGRRCILSKHGHGQYKCYLYRYLVMIFTMVTGFVEGQSKYKSVGTGQRDNLPGECPTVEWGAGAGGDPKGG